MSRAAWEAEPSGLSSFQEWTLKIFIADDEELMRVGLVKMIERMELPVTVVGSASDGLEALELIAAQHPDVLLTDIRMPKMDGLALIERLAEQGAAIRTVILSGYDDFDYAKKAIKMGCRDYLVKPPDFAELSQLLKGIYGEFAQERKKSREDRRKNELLSRHQPLLQTDWLRRLVAGSFKLTPEELRDQAEKLDIRLAPDDYAVALFHCEKQEEIGDKYTRAEWDLLKYACWNIAAEIAPGLPCFYDEREHLLLLLPAGIPFEESCERLQEIRRCLAHYLNLTFSAALSSPVPLRSLPEAYRTCRKLLVLRRLRENSVLITCREALAHVHEDIGFHLDQLEQLQKTSSLQELGPGLQRWLAAVKSSLLAPAAVERLEQELRVALTVLYGKLPPLQEEIDAASWRRKLELADSLSAQTEPLVRAAERMAAGAPDKPYPNQAVGKAVAYIREHYRRDINLTVLAELVHMNPAYFSVMFKKTTGLGVVEYVTEIRLEAAKKLLLETELKTYQIADAAGYRDAAYFSNLFKRNVGMTPQEYRNRAAINTTRNP